VTDAAGDRARPPRYYIDQSRCATCGRDAVGLRCDQCVTTAYEQQLVRSRAVQIRDATSPWPETAPCGDACPLSLCIQGYANHIAAGQYAEALGHIMVRTPLPESVCRVCDRPCERVCVRAGVDESVAINDLKRFVVEWAAAQSEWPWQPPQEARTGHSVAVVGAGPAGLAAAWDLRLRGHDVVLFDAADRPGGILAHAIPEYRLPRAALERDIQRLLGFGVAFVGGMALGRDRSLTDLLDDFEAIFLAVGLRRGRRLEIIGAEVDGAPSVIDAISYLERVRAGAEDGQHGHVVVVGGGNAAVDAARTALRLGAESVSMACIEARAQMPALPEEIVAAEREGIAIHPALTPARLLPRAIAFVPVDGGSEVRFKANRVIAAIGQEPDRAFLHGGPELVLGPDGTIDVDAETGRTSHERIFAGGDIAGRKRTVTGAMARGLRAAWAIDRLLHGQPGRRLPPLLPRNDFEPRSPVLTRHLSRRHPPELEPRARAGAFVEVVGVFGEAEARAEAARCLICGNCGNCRSCVDLFGCPGLTIRGEKAVIEPGLCTGCGVCAQLCANGAIRLEDGSDG